MWSPWVSWVQAQVLASRHLPSPQWVRGLYLPMTGCSGRPSMSLRHWSGLISQALSVSRRRRAERAFVQVEPENRLVARTLEARWEATLAALAEAEAALVTARAVKPALPDHDALLALAGVSWLARFQPGSPRSSRRSTYDLKVRVDRIMKYLPATRWPNCTVVTWATLGPRLGRLRSYAFGPLKPVLTS